MKTQKIVSIDLDFEFDFELMEEGSFVCSNLPDRVITIKFNSPKVTSHTLDKFGQKQPLFTSNSCIYTTVFKESKFSFFYEINGKVSFGSSKLDSDDVITTNISRCILHYLSEDYCKRILSLFNTDRRLSFSRAIEAGFPRFTIEGSYYVNSGLQYLQKNFIYEKSSDTLYHNVDKPTGKFYGCFEGIDFSESFFYLNESMNNTSFKFKIFHKKAKKYINLTYINNELSVDNFIDNTHDLFVGDVAIQHKLEELISTIIIETPNKKLANYANEFGLDWHSLTKNDIKTIVMAYY